MRYMLIDKQGNFGSIAGLPPAAMRYTEARMSPFAAMMLDDLKLDTVDFVPTYDERHTEPTVLPSKFPNLLVNGSGGIAVGMATSIPPHNLGEVCRGIVALIDNPHITVQELMEHIPGPDFPTGGIICGKNGDLEGLRNGPQHDRRPLEDDDRRSARATATGSSSTTFPTSRPATRSSRRSPTSPTKATSPASPASATRAISKSRCGSSST